MDYNKKTEFVRKRNAELLQELNDLKQRFEMDSFERKKIEVLSKELERIKEEWSAINKELVKRNQQYTELISDLRGMKSIMLKMSFGLPWHKRLVLRIKKFFIKLFHRHEFE